MRDRPRDDLRCLRAEKLRGKAREPELETLETSVAGSASSMKSNIAIRLDPERDITEPRHA